MRKGCCCCLEAGAAAAASPPPLPALLPLALLSRPLAAAEGGWLPPLPKLPLPDGASARAASMASSSKPLPSSPHNPSPVASASRAAAAAASTSAPRSACASLQQRTTVEGNGGMPPACSLPCSTCRTRNMTCARVGWGWGGQRAGSPAAPAATPARPVEAWQRQAICLPSACVHSSPIMRRQLLGVRPSLSLTPPPLLPEPAPPNSSCAHPSQLPTRPPDACLMYRPPTHPPTCSFSPNSSQDLRKPVCTSGRVCSRRRRCGGCGERQNCKGCATTKEANEACWMNVLSQCGPVCSCYRAPYTPHVDRSYLGICLYVCKALRAAKRNDQRVRAPGQQAVHVVLHRGHTGCRGCEGRTGRQRECKVQTLMDGRQCMPWCRGRQESRVRRWRQQGTGRKLHRGAGPRTQRYCTFVLQRWWTGSTQSMGSC